MSDQKEMEDKFTQMHSFGHTKSYARANLMLKEKHKPIVLAGLLRAAGPMRKHLPYFDTALKKVPASLRKGLGDP